MGGIASKTFAKGHPKSGKNAKRQRKCDENVQNKIFIQNKNRIK